MNWTKAGQDRYTTIGPDGVEYILVWDKPNLRWLYGVTDNTLIEIASDTILECAKLIAERHIMGQPV